MTHNLPGFAGFRIGGSFGLIFVTDHSGSNAGYTSLGRGIVTKAPIGAAFAIGFYPKVSTNYFTDWG